MIFKILFFIGIHSSRMPTTLTSFNWTVKRMQNLKQTTGRIGHSLKIALKVDSILVQLQPYLLRKKIGEREIGRWRNYSSKRVSTKKLKLKLRRNRSKASSSGCFCFQIIVSVRINSFALVVSDCYIIICSISSLHQCMHSSILLILSNFTLLVNLSNYYKLFIYRTQ